MSEPLSLLLTNDDGIDATGFRALYDDLQEVGDVTAVAPARDQSAMGRAVTYDVTVEETEMGYAIDGTPADCVIAGLGSLVPDADIVVAGCNEGANIGAYNLGRSGTVSAAVEAAFFSVPAMAVSMYVPVSDDRSFDAHDPAYDDFRVATRAAAYLCDRAPAAGVFDRAEYLNVNAPVPADATGEMEITRPSHVHMLDADRQGTSIKLHDPVWERMAEGKISDPEGTDRRALVGGKVSVSPLTAPHSTEHHDALDALVGAYPGHLP
ncbi:MAG: 5'/3'-nucleotidase SurE [Haloarculaceae archaeon]